MPFVLSRNYAFRLRNIDTVDVQSVGERLERLRVQKKGSLIAKDVVDDARNKRTAYHPMFEWDDAIAGDLFRLEQARELLEIIRETDDPDNPDGERRRLFLNVNEGKGERKYRSIIDIMSDRSLQLRVLKSAENDLRQFESRYAEIVDICNLVRGVRERIIERRRQVEAAERKEEVRTS